MTPSDIRAVVKDELGRIAPEIELDSIDEASDMRRQMDMDSMDFLNFVTALHQRLGLAIPESDYPKLSTLKGLYAYLGEHS